MIFKKSLEGRKMLNVEINVNAPNVLSNRHVQFFFYKI